MVTPLLNLLIKKINALGQLYCLRCIISLLICVHYSTQTIDASDTNWEVSGFVGAEARGFFRDPQFNDQLDSIQTSLIAQPEIRLALQDNAHQFTLIPFVRWDHRDNERTHFDLREAYWRFIAENWELVTGVSKVFWGVTESRHLVDIINQTDVLEDIDEEDKLGQPMIHLKHFNDWGTVSLFVLPGFREQRFPGQEGRLRAQLPINDNDSMYESSHEEWHVDFAARYAHYIDNWDFGAYYFYGTSRDPILKLAPDGSSLTPLYTLIHQIGLDAQYTVDAWLWKFEGIVREGQGNTFAATVFGLEYTLYQILSSNADLGWLIEYLYDGRDEDEAPPTALDNDLFFGARLALNDIQDTEVLLGATIDRKDQSSLVFIELERRLGENWKIELESRLFFNIDSQNLLQSVERDSFVTLRASHFF